MRPLYTSSFRSLLMQGVATSFNEWSKILIRLVADDVQNLLSIVIAEKTSPVHVATDPPYHLTPPHDGIVVSLQV